MQQILVYADSLSWGIIPTTRRRLAFDARWPGVLDAGQHLALGAAIAAVVRPLVPSS